MHPVLCIIWLSYQRPSARKNTIHQYFLNILYAKCLIYKHSINNMSQGCEMMIFSFLVLASLTSHSHSKFRFHFGTLFSELTNISKGCLKFQYQISLRTHARLCQQRPLGPALVISANRRHNQFNFPNASRQVRFLRFSCGALSNLVSSKLAKFETQEKCLQSNEHKQTQLSGNLRRLRWRAHARIELFFFFKTNSSFSPPHLGSN